MSTTCIVQATTMTLAQCWYEEAPEAFLLAIGKKNNGPCCGVYKTSPEKAEEA